MRTAFFMLGMLINSGLQMLAESSGYELELSDSFSLFIMTVFWIFLIMDIVEFFHKIVKGK
jgi:hypothetical protein